VTLLTVHTGCPVIFKGEDGRIIRCTRSDSVTLKEEGVYGKGGLIVGMRATALRGLLQRHLRRQTMRSVQDFVVDRDKNLCCDNEL